jgi:hypothetical protein
MNDQALDCALANEIDGRAGEENRNLQSGGQAAIGYGECDRRPPSSIPWVMTTTSSRVASAISTLRLSALPREHKRGASGSLQN